MDIEKIQKELASRFAEPLKDYYKRRIIFWHDGDKEFESFIDELELPNVKILKMTGSNNFLVKKTLLHDDTESDYLVYSPIRYDKIQDDWLLDVALANEEFRADLVSMRMQELGVTQNAEMRKCMRAYSKFFDNKERVAKLLSFKTNYNTPAKLQIDILAVLSAASANTASAVITAVLCSGIQVDENTAIENMKKFGCENVFWKLVSNYTGYNYSVGDSLEVLAAHIIFTALTVTLDTKCLLGLEKLISLPHGQRCYDLVSEWMNSDKKEEYYDIVREIEIGYCLNERFSRFEISELANSESLPCIDECILSRFMKEVAENVVKSEEIISFVERRRTLVWYDKYRFYFDALMQVANMYKFYLDHADGFHVAQYTKLWNEYRMDYCKMDHFYRMFHTAFGKNMKLSEGNVLDDMFIKVADYVENLYKNWYLAKLGEQWNKLIYDEVSSDVRLSGIEQQEDFYSTKVKPLSALGKTYVIISDALRYEVAVEITGKLLRETKGMAKIGSMQSAFPSVTKFGMAALLPHKTLILTDDGKVLCDGRSTDGIANRSSQLSYYGGVALTYKSLLTLTKQEFDSMTGDSGVVYIYHNTIDTIGDKLATEDRVFEACEDAINEITNLVKRIVNTFKGTNILITSDHGFIYSHKPIDELDKADKGNILGDISELERRYVIVNGDCSADNMMKVSLKHYGSDFNSFAPMQYVRIKRSGGGINYVHGGLSLHEIVVPIIEFKNLKSTSKKYVDVKKAELQLLSQTRKICNNIFSLEFYQKDEVGGKIVPAEYEIFISDSAGKAVSDCQMIIADKTSKNGSERVFRIRLTLKSVDFKNTDIYYLNIVDKETQTVIERVEFGIDIAFTNDFDF